MVHVLKIIVEPSKLDDAEKALQNTFGQVSRLKSGDGFLLGSDQYRSTVAVSGVLKDAGIKDANVSHHGLDR